VSYMSGAVSCTSLLGSFEVGEGGSGGAGGDTGGGGTTTTVDCTALACCVASDCPPSGSECGALDKLTAFHPGVPHCPGPRDSSLGRRFAPDH